MTLEETIISNIFYDFEFATKILPFTKEEYFEHGIHPKIIRLILCYFSKYNGVPTKDQIIIDSKTAKGLSDKDVQAIAETLSHIERETSDRSWLIQKTESYYRDRALTIAIINSASIIENRETARNGEILKMVENALGIGFDNTVGHQYFDDYEERFKAYHEKEDKIATGVKALDDITLGGYSRKSLSCVMGSSGTGKSMFLVSTACDALRQGYNVLYITLELSEIRIAERFDSNLMNILVPRLADLDLKTYSQKISDVKSKMKGRLFIKEFPTASISVLNIRSLLSELKVKKNFVPDLICVDYVNLMLSSRYKSVNGIKSYDLVKAISEELRGLAVETNTAVITATQTNRDGFNNSDLEVTDVSESIGIVFTLDLFFALVRTDELDRTNQVIIKQLKNRYTAPENKPVLKLGADRDHMRFYDLDTDDYRVNEEVYMPTRKVDLKKKVIGDKPKNDFGKFVF